MKNMLLTLAATIFITTAAQADVRVEITRNLPDGIRVIVQEFNDTDEFQMWMITRLEDECKPGVTKIDIDLDYTPVWKEKS